MLGGGIIRRYLRGVFVMIDLICLWLGSTVFYMVVIDMKTFVYT